MTNLTFEILGPLTSRRDGTLCRPGRPKARQVLGTLLLHANRFVSADLIADVLWGETPPRSATANIRTYVHDLRHTLVGAAGESPIQTHSCGYSIHVEPARLDSTRFLALAAGAATLATDGDDAGALHTAEQAYTLWRGHPLDDLPMAAAWQMPLGSLEHAHKELLDLLVDLWLRNGRHQPASALLRTRIAEDPYSEPLWCRYISCLADSGRPDEARAAAGEIRRLLTEELGLTPGERLCRLERELATVPGGGTPPASRPTDDADLVTPGRHVPPSQLPLDLSDFTGREAHLSELRALLAGDGPPRPPVAVISGPPGAGKTALAVHLGHLTTARYADGQIFLDLRATTQPREPAAAIAELLRSLGVAEAAIPAELDRRSAMLRSELAGQRVLVVLDDAASASQVAPLLPGTGSSAMLITSRRRLTDLAGVTHRTLGEFDDHEAGALLEQVIAPDRAPLQAAQAEAILRACGNLPLAIRIAGSRLVQRRDLSANDLVARLRDERRRLDELSVGDLTVRTSADLSYRMLGEPEARMYRMLGLLGAEELPAWLLGASGIGPDPERCVAALVEANLVQLTRNDALTTSRYRIHDLLRCHARELAMSTAPEQARQDLATMLTALLGRTTEAAASLPVRFLGVTLDPTPPGDTPDPVSCARDSLANSGAQPAARGVVVADPTPGSTPPPPCEPPPGHRNSSTNLWRRTLGLRPLDWFDVHRHALAHAVKVAAENGLDGIGWQVAAAWAPYLDLRAHYDDWDDSHQAGLDCARRAGSQRGEAIMLRNLGQLALYRDDYATAEESLRIAYQLFEGLRDPQGLGMAALGRGTCGRVIDDEAGALHWYHTALDHLVAAGDTHGEAAARNAIGGALLQSNHTADAAPWLKSAYELSVEIGDHHREAQVRRRIAVLKEQEGDRDAAVRELRTALNTLTGIGDDHCASYVQRNLGELLASRGELQAARRMLVCALNVGHRLGDRRGEALAAAQLGDLHHSMGHADSARQYHRRARRAWPQVSPDAHAAR